MDQQELENNIRKTLKGSGAPSRASLMYVLRKIEEDVTNKASMRYNKQTGMSNIISDKLVAIFDIWKSRKLVLIPSLIALLVVGAFSLSPQSIMKTNLSLTDLVEQDALINESGVDYDEQIVLTSLDEPYIDDLNTIQNEI